jgi:hypothetical protein
MLLLSSLVAVHLATTGALHADEPAPRASISQSDEQFIRGQDQALRQFAAETPIIQAHHRTAEDIQKNLTAPRVSAAE